MLIRCLNITAHTPNFFYDNNKANREHVNQYIRGERKKRELLNRARDLKDK